MFRMSPSLLMFLLLAVVYGDTVQLAPVTTSNGPLTTIQTNNGDATALLRGTGGWNGGWWQAPLKYVMYTFDATYELASIQLVVDQQPNGDTKHQVIDQNGLVIATFEGYTKRFQMLNYRFPAGTLASSLKILTTASTSNAAWFTINIIANKASSSSLPYFHLAAPVPEGSYVPTTITSNSGNATALLRGIGAWNGGWWDFPYKYVTYNFGGAIELDRIILIVDQSPSGYTSHELINSNDKVIYTFSGNTQKFQELSYVFPTGTITNSLTIQTTASTSNVAWLSVTILRK